MSSNKRLKASLAGINREAKEKHIERERQLAEWRASHPVSSGAVPVVAYVPPRGSYSGPVFPN